MEFSDDGDLYQKIVQQQKAQTPFDEEHIWRTLIHVVIGLKNLHELNILHRDLKVLLPLFRVPMFFCPKMEQLNWVI
jgi:serine/threonine protein kinase